MVHLAWGGVLRVRLLLLPPVLPHRVRALALVRATTQT